MNLAGSEPINASRHSFGNPNPITVSSFEKATYTILPTRNFTRPRTSASVVRGKVLANARTSSSVTIAATSSPSPPEAAWTRWRATRDELFGAHPQSPLPADGREAFESLDYFSYDPSL